jgi:DNA invertase Pin-like site-specific DNA recombinase
MKRVRIYMRVSTGDQSTDMQRRELEAWAERAGHVVHKVYADEGKPSASPED